jgi:hypothetical protein
LTFDPVRIDDLERGAGALTLAFGNHEPDSTRSSMNNHQSPIINRS